MEDIEQSNAEPTPVEETNTAGLTSAFTTIDLQLLGGPAEAARGNGNSKMDLSVRPEAAQTQNLFGMIKQGPSTNAFTKMRATEEKGLTVDQITGDATITSGNYILSIPKYAYLTGGLKTSAYQLFDAITLALTENGAKSSTVVIPLSEYMESRGLKNRKEAKEQAKADMEILRTASIRCEERKNKEFESYGFVNIADSGEVKRNGDIVFTFGTTYYKTLKSYPVMPYSLQALKADNKRNPNTYYLSRKIDELKNMNIGKKNEDIISVRTLLSAAPYLPSYDAVMASDRAVNRRIIEPFERDMDALSDTRVWTYCHSNGAPLTDEETETMSYDIFKDLLVKIDWKQYPDQTARLERKAERIAQAEKAKGTRPKGKNPSKKKTTK